MFLTTLLMSLLSLCKCVSTAKIFFPTSSRSRQIYFSTLQQLSWCSKNPSTNGIKERKRKETDVSLPHWAKISSSSGLPRLLLDIEFLRSDLFFFFLNSSILTSLHMTKIITQKKILDVKLLKSPKKITTNTRIVGFLARRSDKKSPSKKCGNKRRRKSGATGWRRKGRGTFSWTRARMAGDKGGRPVRPPAHLPAQAGIWRVPNLHLMSLRRVLDKKLLPGVTGLRTWLEIF